MATDTVTPSWEETVNEQGWKEASQIIHLERFIRSQGLGDKLDEYAAAAAAEENSAVLHGGPSET